MFYPQYVPSNDNQLRIGLRFDSEDIAAVMLNINLNKHKFGKAEIAVRGGKQSFLRTQYHFPISKPQWITLSNQLVIMIYFYTVMDTKYLIQPLYGILAV